MSRPSRPVFTELPAGSGWDFGGLPYGLESVTLPSVGTPDRVAREDLPVDDGDGHRRVCDRLRLIRDRGGAAVDLEPCQGADELFWFRWITGHQVCFVVWRLMAQVLNEARDGRVAPEAAVGLLCRYIRGYCAMLLYTGSCPRTLYHGMIRPSMRLRHPSFSGTWAPDYAPVRELFRARRSALAWPTDQQAQLHRALRLHHLVHDGVAATLVPNGRSLLRQSTAPPPDVRLLGVIYDTYFMTLRAPVSRPEIVAQLLRRLLAIAQDLAVNDLHPGGVTDCGDQAEELLTPEVTDCGNNLLEILRQVAAGASGSPEAVPSGVRPAPVSAPSPT